MRWRAEEGTTVLVIPIDAPERTVRFEVQAFFQYHFMNAYEQGDSVVVDFVRVADFGTAFRSHDLEERPAKVATEGRLYRAVVTPAKRTLKLEERWETPCEFPQIAPSVQGV